MLLITIIPQKKWFAFAMLLILAAGFRLAVAHWFPNDAPDDGRIYAQIARNVVEQHVYSHETEAPYDPSFIRLPGYPLFLAGVYAVFGHSNNGAARIAQALIDTATCALVALLAFYWQPDEKRKRVTAIAALALAAACPFTAIYAATILTEVPTNFFVMAMCLAATLALRNGFTTEDTEESAKDRKSFKRSVVWWSIAGLLGGGAVMFRPDCGLFMASIGFTLVMATIWRWWISHRKHSRRFSLTVHSKLSRLFVFGAAFALGFAVTLAPWTIRNWRVFHLFQPLSPVNAEMPGEFIPHGYLRWVKTWLDDQRYIDVAVWEVGIQPITLDDLPGGAFDSAAERDRVAALLDQYNHPPNAQVAEAKPEKTSAPTISPTPTPAPGVLNAQATPTPPVNQMTKNENDNSNSSANEQAGDSDDQGDDNGDDDQSDDAKTEAHGPVAMTPEIDAAFGQFAAERIARHPLRFYLWMPMKRAAALWFNTHSDYYPFEGTLLPLDDLDHDIHQHIWLPLFVVLVGFYTLAGLAGALVLWLRGDFYSRSWVLLVSLIIVSRLAFFSTLENPEPRYVVEFFPFLAALGGIAFARLWRPSVKEPAP